jgi:hypothetical protein
MEHLLEHYVEDVLPNLLVAAGGFSYLVIASGILTVAVPKILSLLGHPPLSPITLLVIAAPLRRNDTPVDAKRIANREPRRRKFSG